MAREKSAGARQPPKRDRGYNSDEENKYEKDSRNSTEVDDYLSRYKKKHVVLESSPEGDERPARKSSRVQKMADEIAAMQGSGKREEPSVG